MINILGMAVGTGAETAVQKAVVSAVTNAVSNASSLSSSPNAPLSNYVGEWGEAQGALTTYIQTLEDTLAAQKTTVLGDLNLLLTVGSLHESGYWDPTNPWAERSLKSYFRQSTAVWAYQTLVPAVWDIAMVGMFPNAPKLAVYNKGKDAPLQLVTNVHSIARSKSPSESVLKTMFDPVNSSCRPLPTNNAKWQFGKCDVDLSRDSFFQRKGPWAALNLYDCTNPEYGCTKVN